ncbi:MAG: transposase [Pseudobdellovibrionaceae bacterium]
MSRKIPAHRTDCPYHVTARTNNREWFELDLGEVWEIFEEQLFFIHHAYGIKIHCFVLMTNHFHLILTDSTGTLGKAMRWLMTETSREIGRRTGRKNRIYGQRNFKCLITSYHYYMHAYKYVYRNPVEVGSVHHTESYPYSTLHGLVGKKKLVIPVEEDPLMEDMDGNLKWLNSATEKQDWEIVGKALRKGEFKLAKDKNRNCEAELEKRRL